ncbi:MAG: hypothetical protein MUD12_02130 [Spirochaetes bacterium]|jgi:hypothetical protein|nr:hypothetical protein [Spirochaetota bacterium]
MNRAVANNKEISPREELISYIRERVSHLTNNETFKTLDLGGLSVSDGSRGYMGGMNTFRIYNIFLDENGSLCSDLSMNGDEDVFFGRNIEDIYLDDLEKILNKLYSGEWEFLENREDTGEKKGGDISFIKHLAGIRLFKRSA